MLGGGKLGGKLGGGGGWASTPGLPDGIFSNQKNKTFFVNFGGPCNVRCWYILWPFGIFYGHLVYFIAIW
jgi:hypothetical protein